MQDLNITIVQSDLHWEDKEKNLQNFKTKLEKVKNTDIIILPEMFNTAFSMKPELFAETMNDNTIQWMKKMAHLKKSVVVGSLMIRENDKYYNRMIWMNPEGNYEFYDKRHLFRMQNEHKHFSAGSENKIVNFKGWKFKLMVCYDLRFPVWAKNNYKDGNYDYDCLVFVANWPEPRRHPWKHLLQSRAMENQAYVIGVNRVGADGKGIRHSGDSMACNPIGDIMLEFEEYAEAIASVNLRFADIEKIRKNFTVGLDWDSFDVII